MDPAATDLPHSPKGLFAPEGPLARRLGAFEPRDEQTRMAAAVQEALESGENLVVEAGTGVGKSLAYLLPCALWAVQNGKKVVVATYTKALQEQLLQKDLPVVESALAELGIRFQYALLMGTDNYLCVQRLHRCLKKGPELFDAGGHEAILGDLREWSADASTGQRSRIPFPVPDAAWEAVCRDADLCLGRRGPFWEDCLYRKDAARARAADLVVVNQHLFFAGIPLPPFDAVVMDEAHNLEEVAAQFLGFSLTNRRLRRLLDDIHSPRPGRGLARRVEMPDGRWLERLQAALEAARAGADSFFDELLSRFGREEAPRPEGRGREAGARSLRVREPGIAQDRASGALIEVAALLSEAAAAAKSAEDESEIQAHRDRCLASAGRLREFLECKSRDHAYWVEASDSKRGRLVSLSMAPLDVSAALRRDLFDGSRPVVLASATLAVGGSFEMARSRLGFVGARERILASPFDYPTQAALFLDGAVPDPKAEPEAYERAVLSRCLEIIPLVPGGTFVLFTSWHLLEAAARRFAAAAPGRPVFKQGELPPYELLEAFKKSGRGVLLGTDTFWQGVDVPGEALACVIITRLPFLAPDSPLEEARHEWMEARGRHVFTEYTLPKAVIKFRQGFGRLIRSRTDSGAVVLLDPRVRTRPYGAAFLSSIPECRRVESLSELRAFFESRGLP